MGRCSVIFSMFLSLYFPLGDIFQITAEDCLFSDEYKACRDFIFLPFFCWRRWCVWTKLIMDIMLISFLFWSFLAVVFKKDTGALCSYIIFAAFRALSFCVADAVMMEFEKVERYTYAYVVINLLWNLAFVYVVYINKMRFDEP